MAPVVAGAVPMLVGYLNKSAQIGQQSSEMMHTLCLSQDLPHCTKQKQISDLSQSLDDSIIGLLFPVQDLLDSSKGRGITAACLLDTLLLHLAIQELHKLSLLSNACCTWVSQAISPLHVPSGNWLHSLGC